MILLPEHIESLLCGEVVTFTERGLSVIVVLSQTQEEMVLKLQAKNILHLPTVPTEETSNTAVLDG